MRLAAEPDYEAVIDVQDIPCLSRMGEDEKTGRIEIGAAATLQMLVEAPQVPALLKQVITRVVTLNRRNAISLAEAIEFAHELPEVMAVLIALDASLVFASPEEVTFRLAELLKQPQGGLPESGLILRVSIPRGTPWRTWGVAQVAATPTGKAIVSAAAVLEADEAGVIQEARIGFSGVWPFAAGSADLAASALLQQALDAPAIEQAVARLAEELDPVADYRGGVAYRQAMATVLLRRVLETCRDRLNS